MDGASSPSASSAGPPVTAVACLIEQSLLGEGACWDDDRRAADPATGILDRIAAVTEQPDGPPAPRPAKQE